MGAVLSKGVAKLLAEARRFCQLFAIH